MVKWSSTTTESRLCSTADQLQSTRLPSLGAGRPPSQGQPTTFQLWSSSFTTTPQEQDQPSNAIQYPSMLHIASVT